MVLLVAMVLAKAFLFDYDQSADDFTARNESTISDVDVMADLRASLQPSLTPKSELLAAHICTPDLTEFEMVSESSNEIHLAYHFEDEDLAIENGPNQEDEIIPMDYVSNTGYGMWRASNSEENTAHDDLESEGIVPLDRGNTITDNISRLFPRVP